MLKFVRLFFLYFFYCLVNFLLCFVIPFLLFLILLKNLIKEFTLVFSIFLLANVIMDLIVPLVALALFPFTYLLGRSVDLLLLSLEYLCFFYYFLWEGWLVKYRGIFLVIFHIIIIYFWCFFYIKFLFFWYDGLCLCCKEWSFAHCSQMFVPLTLVTLFFLEVRRYLRVYLARKILKIKKEKAEAARKNQSTI